jgi:hypothetical protein
MDAQLRLMAEIHSADSPEAPASWRIDPTTKAVGRSGIALAREALRQARRPPRPAGAVEQDHRRPVAA